MAKWNYNLQEDGTKLRQLISEDKEAEIIEQIEVCCKSLLSQLTSEDKEYYEDRIEELIGNLTGEANTIRNDPSEITEDWGFDSIQGLVNERLSELYDVCDSCRCWVQF